MRAVAEDEPDARPSPIIDFPRNGFGRLCVVTDREGQGRRRNCKVRKTSFSVSAPPPSASPWTPLRLVRGRDHRPAVLGDRL